MIMIGIWKLGFKSQCHSPITSYMNLSKSLSLLFSIYLIWVMLPHRMVVRIKSNYVCKILSTKPAK